ncbi:aldo/keto reductase [Thalassiella azotivora]
MSIPTTKTVRGVAVPTLGIGTWEVTGDTATDTVADALAAGYRHVDTAAAYGNEEQVGEGLRRSGLARDEYWLTSKVWRDDYEPSALRASAERSLRLLGVDHLDLLLLHWPVEDWAVMEAGLGELKALRERGLVREVGVSNAPSQLLHKALDAVPEVFADQVEYHAHLSQQKLLATAAERDVMITAYSPLANGKGLLEDPVLVEVAKERDATPGQVAIAWLARQERVTVLPRSTNPDRRRENLSALEVDLTDADVARLDELSSVRRRYIDPPFAPEWD